ncbi:G-box-binding factor 3 isoform X2 [Brachypodium distachyon]|nr:G-box-binding factor 3 isoform X2 [Brachypodium distachyon]|eukprot:XP_010232100.1 G-box-binding factor 3 isoform X2 [Brachypodium distachyon]
MGHDEAVVIQNSGKAPSPPKDQPALYPCLDWSTMQAYYGPGIMPPTYFCPGLVPGHAPPPYMWSPQPLLPSASAKPYTAVHPHGGGFSHPFMPLMVNPLSVEPAKSVNSDENNQNKKLKEVDGTAVSTGSGHSEKTSWDCSVGGSSDGNIQKASGTPKKRRLHGTPIADGKKALHYSAALETGGTTTGNDVPGEQGRPTNLPSLYIPDRAIKPNASTASDFSVIGTPISTEFPDQDRKESKRERRKQSNRESARRSRLRKQAETEELAKKVELLTAENTSLRRDIRRLTESSKKLRSENSALMATLTEAAPDQTPEASADQTAEQSARAAKNFMPVMDSTSASRNSGHMAHGVPKLRQLLGSRLASDAVAAR